MTKTTIFSLAGLIIVVGVIVAFAATRPKDKAAETPIVIATTESTGANASDQGAPTTPTGKKMAFMDFAKQGGAYECTVNQYIDSSYTSTTKGTVYISKGNIRGNYNVKVQGMSIDTSVIVRDGFAYTWTNMMTTGYKVAVATDTTGKTSAGGTTPQGTFSWNSDMIGDYDCKPWTADAAMFTLPAKITFKTI